MNTTKQQTLTKITVHLIRRWDSTAEGETPLCGRSQMDSDVFMNRTWNWQGLKRDEVCAQCWAAASALPNVNIDGAT